MEVKILSTRPDRNGNCIDADALRDASKESMWDVREAEDGHLDAYMQVKLPDDFKMPDLNELMRKSITDASAQIIEDNKKMFGELSEMREALKRNEEQIILLKYKNQELVDTIKLMKA